MNLSDLKVESFVTTFQGCEVNTIKGGNGHEDPPPTIPLPDVPTNIFVCLTIELDCR